MSRAGKGLRILFKGLQSNPAATARVLARLRQKIRDQEQKGKEGQGESTDQATQASPGDDPKTPEGGTA